MVVTQTNKPLDCLDERDCGDPEVSSAEARNARVPIRINGALSAAASRGGTAPDGGPVATCRRYFRAIGARDLDAMLDAMTPEYGVHLREMRRLPEFAAFFSLWCENQGSVVSVISSSVNVDVASVVLDTQTAIVRVALLRIGGSWLVDSEQVERDRNRRHSWSS